jgi:RNA polymerase sigma-70 factor (ECF subfamily)
MGSIERRNASSEVSALFLELRAPLLRYLACLGIGGDDGRDIAQEAFLRLCRDYHAIGGRDHARAWLFRVAHNEARNRQKSGERRFMESLQAPAGAYEQITSGDDDPERALIRKQRSRRMQVAIERLTALERECLLLRSEGLRYREIAEALEIGVSTAAETIYRAIRKLGEECNV